MLHLLTAPSPVFGQAQGGAGIAGLLLPIAILGAVFYFLLILPQRKRSKQAKELRESLVVGDEIRTIGGIYGVIHAEDEETFTLDIGGGTRLRIAKRAVAMKIGDEET